VYAQIIPLEGKYYGTGIEVFDNNNESVGFILIWLTPHSEEDYKPSARESIEEVSDNHYECALTYRIALTITQALNRP
jgi:hypothetical protein